MRLCNNGTDVVPELMMFKLSFCFSVSTSLSPSVTPSWWFQVWVYWCFMASDLLSHTLNADAHTQCSTPTCESGEGAHNRQHARMRKCWLRCHSAPRPPLPFNDTERRTQAADGGCIVKRIDSEKAQPNERQLHREIRRKHAVWDRKNISKEGASWHTFALYNTYCHVKPNASHAQTVNLT